MIVTAAELYRLACGCHAIGAHNVNHLEQTMGLFSVPVEEVRRINAAGGTLAPARGVDANAQFIAHKNTKPGGAGGLPAVRATPAK